MGDKNSLKNTFQGRQDESGNQLKCVHEAVNDRWEIAFAPSGKGFQQISFVNSIATTKGGRHVEYVTEMISKHLQEHIKKKNKTGAEVKPHAIKSQRKQMKLRVHHRPHHLRPHHLRPL